MRAPAKCMAQPASGVERTRRGRCNSRNLEGSTATLRRNANIRLLSPLRRLKPQLVLRSQRRKVGRDQLRHHILELGGGPLGPTVLVDDERANPLGELTVFKQAHA